MWRTGASSKVKVFYECRRPPRYAPPWIIVSSRVHDATHEILSFIESGLEDVSFSRSTHALTWGIPVPDDPGQTIYVWADALTNYISALGYATNNDEKYQKYWPADVHLIGKDILRFHAMFWPAMLLAADIPLPKAIYVHGFVTVDGQKMSKTIGNVIDPFKVAEKYGSEVVRYFLLREIPSGNDGDFSYKSLEARYNADLANGLGNLVQRVATLIETKMDGELIYNKNLVEGDFINEILDDREYHRSIGEFRLHNAVEEIWRKISIANVYIDDKKPWELVKTNPDGFLKCISGLVAMIYHISWLLQPFMPETTKSIAKRFSFSLKGPAECIENNFKFLINKNTGLFPRL